MNVSIYIKLLTLAFFGFFLIGCDSGETEDPRKMPPLVRSATVQTGGQSERMFTGVIKARVQSDLGFRVSGKIIKRLVDTGQAVKMGDPLMRIDATDLALASRAQSAVVAAAQARAQQTAAEEKRAAALVASGAVSHSVYDQAKADADAARAQLDAAKAQADVLRNEADYAVLLADADGIVMETLAEPGQVVAAGQTVVRLAHAGPREAVVDLPETFRPALGSVANATVFAKSGGDVRATLRQLSASADPVTRTFEARYVLEGTAATAPLGSTVTLRILEEKTDSLVQVPLGALFDQGQGPGVWIIEGADSQVTWRRVDILSLDAETATISGGLKTGERYVTLGAHLLHQGDRVRTAAEPMIRPVVEGATK